MLPLRCGLVLIPLLWLCEGHLIALNESMPLFVPPQNLNTGNHRRASSFVFEFSTPVPDAVHDITDYLV
jgi:hypothetical protein